jgi:hypothetical protein
MNRKGNTMVEAALVFPIIILSLMATIAILMFLFEESAKQAELHLVLRTEAGRQTGTFHGQPGSSSISVERGIKGIRSIINGKTTVTFEEIGILPRTVHKPIEGYQYLADERKYVRYVDFFILEENEDEND